MILVDGDPPGKVSIVMAARVQKSMLLPIGIEVCPGSLKVWTIADRILVKDDRVLPEAQILEVQVNLYPILDGLEGGIPGILTVGVDQSHLDLLRSRRGLCHSRDRRYQQQWGQKPTQTHRKTSSRQGQNTPVIHRRCPI